jgi:hypothetical protein
MGFTEILTIVFIVLKLLGVIEWSWFLVLLPEIIAFVIYIGIIIYNFVFIHNINKTIDKSIKKNWF